MTKRIIYPNESGGLCIIIPFEKCGLTLEQIAVKDVPNGLPFIITNTENIPIDRTFRNAWEADFSNPDGYGE